MNDAVGRYVIYMTTNLVNDKIYIGQHFQKDKSFYNDKYIGSGKYLKLAIKKYGIENFEKKILCTTLTAEDANRLEEEYILKYNSHNPAIGYNRTTTISKSISWLRENDEEAYELFRKRLSNYFVAHDVKHSEEAKRKMSLSKKGRKLGKMSKECCDKHRKAALKQWQTMSEDTILRRNKKISESHLGRDGRKWTPEQIARRTETRRKNGWNKRNR